MPCNSSMWNPELDSIVVGLSIRTLGSAATAGTDDVAPILQVSDVDGGYSCCYLDVCGTGGVVVPRGSSWHRSLVRLQILRFFGCSRAVVGDKLLGEGVCRTCLLYTSPSPRD